jgi:hypothetical protein
VAAVTQIAFQLPETRLTEGSAFSLPVYLRLRSTSAAATPTTISWRIDCLTTGRQIEDDTTVSPASSFTIAVTGTHNAIRNDSNEQETKQLTVTTDEGLATQYREAVRWTVTNIYGVM